MERVFIYVQAEGSRHAVAGTVCTTSKKRLGLNINILSVPGNDHAKLNTKKR
jgi:hypothetical protein